MSSQFQFYATKDDLLLALSEVETHLDLQYADAWMSKTPDIPVLRTLSSWPDLGCNETGRAVGAGFFLIVEAGIVLQKKLIAMDDGTTQYKYAPTKNPSSIVIQPSGIYRDVDSGPEELVLGMCGTAMSDPKSHCLYKRFRKHFTQSMRRTNNGLFIGNNAAKMVYDRAIALSLG